MRMRTMGLILLPFLGTAGLMAQGPAAKQPAGTPPSYYPGIPVGETATAQAVDAPQTDAPAQAPLVPANLTADAPMLPVPFDAPVANTLSGVVGAGFLHDGNVGSAQSHSSDQAFTFTPRVQFQESRAREQWGLFYSSEVDVYRHTSPAYAGRVRDTHTVSGSFGYTPLPRLSLRIRQDYSRTRSPFSVANTALPTLGFLNGTTQVSLNAVTQSIYTSLGSADYTLTENSTLGVSFTSTGYTYDGLNQSQADLRSGRNMNGSAYYSRKFGPRYTLGVQLSLSDMSFATDSAHTRTYGALGMFTITLSDRSSLMLYGGPELSRNRNTIDLLGISVPLSSSSWGPSLGGTYAWRRDTTSFRLQAQHQMSTAGLMRSVKMTSASANLSRQFTRNWLGSISATASDNRSPDLFASYGRLRTVYASAQLARQLTRNLQLSMRYDRIYQHSTGISVYGSHNRVLILLNYTFTKPLGN